jgi:acetyl-CoA synthetase
MAAQLHAHGDIPHLVDPIGECAISLEEYKKKYAESIADVSAYWSKEARERLTWYQPFRVGLLGGLEHGDVTWFSGGKLNVCYNAIDRHVENGKGEQVAMIWEGDETDDIRRITYSEMQRKVSQIAHALVASNVQPGDVVTIYMPMSKCMVEYNRFHPIALLSRFADVISPFPFYCY